MTSIRLSDKITSINIRKKTIVVEVAEQIKKLKWNWAGHLPGTTSRTEDGQN